MEAPDPGSQKKLVTYQETLDYLYARLPMFTRIGAPALKADLTNTLELCRRLNYPYKKFKSIHIGGTNGKGSTSHMLAAVLQTAGYKTGLYTSPHLRDFRERIRINGEMISKEEVVGFVNEQRPAFEEIDPSFFEVTVAMAFDHFARNQVDIAVIEVGLGGRLDSTNVITPELSVITNIGYDHMNILGDTLPKIAFEKAGIIKHQVPVVIGERHPETIETFIAKAREMEATLTVASDKYISQLSNSQTDIENIELVSTAISTKVSEIPEDVYKLDLTGSYQAKNLTTVLTAVDELRKIGFNISKDHVKNALNKVTSLTGLMGRWQILNTRPLIVCDTGHNEDGIREVVKNIQRQKFDRLHMVIGMVKDKDIAKVLSLLPRNAIYYFCSPDMPRAKEAGELKEEAAAMGLNGKSYRNVPAALEAAKENANASDMIFIGGSTFVVAEVV